MSRILFIFPAAPLTANYSGAASRYAQNFASLCELHDEVHVARVGTQAMFDAFAEVERTSDEAQGAKAAAASWHDLVYAPPPPSSGRLNVLVQTALDPVDYVFPEAAPIAQQIAPVIDALQPDMLWVEHIEPAAAMARLKPAMLWVFSNHDLAHRIRKIRSGGASSLRDQWLNATLQRAEKSVLLAADVVVSGSVTDCERLREMGHSRVYPVPMAYKTVPDVDLSGSAGADLRITHLGSLETTANRVGLEAYLRKVHPKIKDAELRIIGDASKVKDPLKSLLTEANANLLGFVPDLADALRPFDISILPYEHDSGYRTKLPVLLSYGQVVVSTCAAVAGTQVAGLDDVCVLLDTLDEFPAAINKLAADPAARERLGRAARDFYEAHFTFTGMLDHYRTIFAGVK